MGCCTYTAPQILLLHESALDSGIPRAPISVTNVCGTQHSAQQGVTAAAFDCAVFGAIRCIRSKCSPLYLTATNLTPTPGTAMQLCTCCALLIARFSSCMECNEADQTISPLKHAGLQGVLRICSRDYGGSWVPVFVSAQQRKNSETYWPVSLSLTQLTCIVCSGAQPIPQVCTYTRST